MAQTGLGDAICHPQRDVPSLVGGSRAGQAQKNRQNCSRAKHAAPCSHRGCGTPSFRFAGDQASTVYSCLAGLVWRSKLIATVSCLRARELKLRVT